MPTGGKLAGAILFGLFGWYLAGVMGPLFPESKPPDYLIPLGAALGVVLGWRMCGKRAGRGYQNVPAIGLTFAAAQVFWTCFIIGVVEMLDNAMRGRFDGPTEAALSVFNELVGVAVYFADVNFLTTLVIGALIAALVTEYAGQRFP